MEISPALPEVISAKAAVLAAAEVVQEEDEIRDLSLEFSMTYRFLILRAPGSAG